MNDRAKSKGTEKPVTAMCEMTACGNRKRGRPKPQILQKKADGKLLNTPVSLWNKQKIHREIKATVHDMDRRNQ